MPKVKDILILMIGGGFLGGLTSGWLGSSPLQMFVSSFLAGVLWYFVYTYIIKTP
jgi:hypothetical protein